MGRGLLAIVSILVLAFLLTPLAVILAGSVTTESILRFPPRGFTLQWYGQALEDAAWQSAILVSSLLAAAATAIAVPLATLASLGLSRSSSRFAGLLRETFMAPLVLPHIVLGAAILQISAALGFVKTFSALLIGHVIIVMPFVLQSVLPLMSRQQRVLEEASADLGATPSATFWHVTLPLIRPGLVTGAIFAFIFSFINVELSVFQTTSNLMTVPVQVFNYVQYQVDPLIAAVSSLTIIVAAIALVIVDFAFGLRTLYGQSQDDR